MKFLIIMLAVLVVSAAPRRLQSQERPGSSKVAAIRIIPMADAEDVAERCRNATASVLRDHGIQVVELSDNSQIPVVRLIIDEIHVSEYEIEGYGLSTLDVWVKAAALSWEVYDLRSGAASIGHRFFTHPILATTGKRNSKIEDVCRFGTNLLITDSTPWK